MKTAFAIALLVIGLAVLAYAFMYECEDDWCLLFDFQKARLADSFERCAALGFPVQESYPRRCSAGGKTFSEETAPLAYKDLLRVAAPKQGALVGSPLVVSGEARGTWYFEASFPVRLLDGNGRELAVVPAQAQGEWMTTEFVPFEATLSFKAPATDGGTLVFEKDNPSGLPEHADSFSLPVRFKYSPPGAQTPG
ncbi:MAG: Gmad2 immunoglobulin-like domain-containing protein [bacterium]|nr:Gmad2 immunoglobulin-like domain-containing protein [bacterium]